MDKGIAPNDGVNAPIGQPINAEIPKVGNSVNAPISVDAQGVVGAPVGQPKVVDAPAPQVQPSGTSRLSFPDTVTRGEITDPALTEQINNSTLNGETITNKDTLEVARKFIQNDKEAALHLVMSDAPATAESNSVAQLLIKEANDSGKFDQAINMIEKTAQKSRTQGQAIQSLSMWGRLSPEGMLKYAERTIEKTKTLKQTAELNNSTKGLTSEMVKVNSQAAENVAKEVESGLGPKLSTKPAKEASKTVIKAPKLSDDIIKKLDTIEAAARARLANRKGSLNSLPVDVWADHILIGSIKLSKGAVNLASWSAEMVKEFGENIKPELARLFEKTKSGYGEFAKSNGLPNLEMEIAPEQQLADRIKASLSNGSPKEKDAIKMMIDTLHKVAKESPLPVNEKIPTDPITFVSDAIRNRTEYKDVWTKAKAIIEEKYKDNPEALALLDNYIGKGIERTFPESQLNRSVGQGLKDAEQNIGDIVRQHYSVGNKATDDLVTQLTNKGGLSGEDATILSKYITERMGVLTKDKKEQILNQMFKPRILRPQKDISQKIIELSNLGGFQSQKYKALIGEKLGIPTLDEATAKAIYEQSNRIQTMPDGREKEVAIAQMLDTVAAKIPPTLLQKVGTLQTMAQLLNPKTAIRNIVGNAGFGAMENVSNVLGAGIDKGVSLITKERTRGLPSLTTQLKSGKEGFKLGLDDALKGISTTSAKTQFDLNASKTFRTGILGKLETGMNIELRAADRAFYQSAYEDTLRSQMKMAGVTEPTEAMKEIADYDGLYKTFQDTNALSSFFSGFKKLLNDPVHFASKSVQSTRDAHAFGIGDFIIKYPKTPASLLSRGLAYSPAGFVKTVMEASKPLMGKEFNQRAFVDSFSRAIVGTSGLVGVGALLNKVGIITGKANADPDVAALDRQVGLGEYKINASALKRFVLSGFNPASGKLEEGDNLVDFSWYQPQALGIAMGADINQNGATASGFAGTVLSGLSTGINTFAEQPLMQGISNMFGQRDFSNGLVKILQGVPASFVPTLLNQAKQLLDNQKRNTYSPNWSEMTMNLAKGKIPVLGSQLQPSYGTLGSKSETFQNGGNNPLNVFLNPATITKFSPTKQEKLALSTYNQTGETKQIPTVMPKFFTVGGQKFTLSSEEYANIQKTVGESTNKAFGKISPSAKTDLQVENMAKAIELARLEGKKTILKNRGVKFTQSGLTLKLKK